MGNLCATLQCACCRIRSTPNASDPNPADGRSSSPTSKSSDEHPDEHQSNLSTGGTQATSLPAAETSAASVSPRLEFTANDITHFQKILDCVQVIISKHEDKPSTSAQRVPENLDVTTILNQSSSEGEQVLIKISDAFEETRKKHRIGKVIEEAKSLFPTILEGLGHVEWAGAGFSMITLVLSSLHSRVGGMSENVQDSLAILHELGELGKHVVKLLSIGLSDRKDMLEKAISLICGGVIWCDRLLQTGGVKRFTFVNVTKDNISSMKSKVDGIYKNLSLATNIENLGQGKQITRQLTKPFAPHKSEYPEDKVGLEDKVADVLRLLEVEGETIQSGVEATLLYGIGGIGKTTLGKAVCAKLPITKEFTAQVEVGVNPDEETILRLQAYIYETLSQQKQRIGKPEAGRHLLKEYFKQCSSSVLLFIDNVYEEDDLCALLPSGLWLPDRSRVIVVSRREGVCSLEKDFVCVKYPVEVLTDPLSEKLFYQHMGECPDARMKQVPEILRMCGGLPLALELVGKHLSQNAVKKNRRAWDYAIEGLRNCHLDTGEKVYKLDAAVRWSYGQLSDGDKELFLDIFLLFRYESWEWAEMAGSGADLIRLTDFSLVKKVDRQEFYLSSSNFGIETHDLLAALAKHESTSATRVLFRDGKSFQKFMQDNLQVCHAITGLAYLDKDLSFMGIQGKSWTTELATLQLGDSRDHEELMIRAEELDAIHESLKILAFKPIKYSIQFGGTCQKTPLQLRFCSIEELIDFHIRTSFRKWSSFEYSASPSVLLMVSKKFSCQKHLKF